MKNSIYKGRYNVLLAVLSICTLLFTSCTLAPKDKENESGSTEAETESSAAPTESTVERTTDIYTDKDYSTPENFNLKLDVVTYGESVTTEYSSTTTGTVRRALVILPYGYDASRKYPVLYLLHGLGANYTTWDNIMNAKYIVQNLRYYRKAVDMIVVCPSVFTLGDKPEALATAPEVVRGYDSFVNDLMNDLMPHINRTYSTLQGRDNTAIAGLSMGGREALYIGFLRPETFGYIGAFSPEGGIIYTGNPKGWLPPLFTELSIKPEIGNFKLILIAVGTLDDVCGYASYEYDRMLNEKSIKHILYELPVGHDIVVWRSGLYNFARRIFK